METVKEWWSVIAATVAGVGWLMRLEGQVRLQSREIVRLWAVRSEDQQAAEKIRTEDRRAAEKTLERIEAVIAELRSDIKQLVKRGE